jgi:hypothetical protein
VPIFLKSSGKRRRAIPTGTARMALRRRRIGAPVAPERLGSIVPARRKNRRIEETQIMKIVAFEGERGAHLGVVEGDQVVDLQAADAGAPSDLGAWLAKTNGDTNRSPNLPNARRRARVNRLRD